MSFPTVNINYLPPGDVGLSDPQHVDRSLVQSEERSIVDLSQTEQLHHLAWSRVDPVDTAIEKKHSHNCGTKIHFTPRQTCSFRN